MSELPAKGVLWPTPQGKILLDMHMQRQNAPTCIWLVPVIAMLHPIVLCLNPFMAMLSTQPRYYLYAEMCKRALNVCNLVQHFVISAESMQGVCVRHSDDWCVSIASTGSAT